jgi:hypothetical protein
MCKAYGSLQNEHPFKEELHKINYHRLEKERMRALWLTKQASMNK